MKVNIPRNLVFFGFLFNRELRAEPRAAIFVLTEYNLKIKFQVFLFLFITLLSCVTGRFGTLNTLFDRIIKDRICGILFIIEF